MHNRQDDRDEALRLGFVPLTDCAPLVMAAELGLFQKYGLRVELSRELGWASVRDKIVHGELDAAHALAAMPLVATLGLGTIACDCLTALVLNLHGNGITLANDLWRRGVHDGRTLREEITRARRQKVFTFGIVFPFSSHGRLLRSWLSAHGIDPVRDVRLVVVPPAQMVTNLRAGHLDGFCAGEPWNSLAVHARAGWLAATSAELEPGHPEKVLMVRSDFAVRRRQEHLAMVAALAEACEFCAQPENRAFIADTLARLQFVGVPAEILKRGLAGQLNYGHGISRQIDDFFVFHREDANEPSARHAAWAWQLVRATGLSSETATVGQSTSNQVFRADLFAEAKDLPQPSHRSEISEPATKPEIIPV